MLVIRLLGGFELVAADGSTGRLGPKPQALVAFLAMTRGAAVPRGRLAGLLWGERDEELARHSLCQALSAIRSALGPAAALIQIVPEGVRLARQGLEVDVDAFESVARSRQQAELQEACELYRGAFLEGIELREPGFEEWQLSERYRLSELAVDTFAGLLDLQIAAGDADAAIVTARRLVAVAPLDEAAHARLIHLYGSLGRRGLAEAHYARCADVLHRDLGLAPGEELRAALAEARRCPPAKSVGFMPFSNGETAKDIDEKAQNRPRNAVRWLRTAWVAAGGAAAMSLLLIADWTFAGLDASQDNAYEAAPWDLPAEPSIAVLPFENLSGDLEQDYFAAGITNDIITDLSRFSDLFVTASHSSSRYGDRAVEVQYVARDLGVRYVLEGSVQSVGGTLRINAHLIDATSGRHVWADSYERPIEDLFAAQKEIRRTIVGVIGSGWGELELAEVERIARTPTEDLRAYELYLRGVAYKQRNTRESNTLARQMFEMAIKADPNYGRAMAECSLTYLNDVFNGWSGSRDDALQMAEELARRAIETDASEPWGLVTLGLVYRLKGWSERALALFEMAHTLNPNDYDITKAFGYAMTWSGSADQAIELLERAQRLDPYEAGEPGHLGAAYFFAHRYRDALAAMNRIANREEVPGYWLHRAATHAQLGQLDQARAAIAEALKLDPELTLESEHERRLALGLAQAYAAQLTEALRKAGLPERRADLPQAAMRPAGRPTP